MSLPLAGIRVVALEHAVAAPFCSRQLADMGAEVIKIERPGRGDFSRDYDQAAMGMSAYFAWLNRGKKSVTLSLKNSFDKIALRRLLATADVFIHNLAPGTVDALGFGWEELHNELPRLIWVSISGYGQTPGSPYYKRRAYDLLIQAESGVVSLTGTPTNPAKVGISIADIAAGLYAYSSTLAALLQRRITGKGDEVDISMLECLTEWAMPPMYAYMGTNKVPLRAGLDHNMIWPYGVFWCEDGPVILAVQNEREWTRFCRDVLEQPGLVLDERFATNQRRLANREALDAHLRPFFAERQTSSITEKLQDAGIAYAKILEIPDVMAHPQLESRKRWTRVESPVGDLQALLPPHNLASAQPVMGRVPALGEHTDEVLDELGLRRPE